MRQENPLDINFWTSFADLMLALVLVLCLLLFLVMAVISIGTVNLKNVELNQDAMVKSIADSYQTVPTVIGTNQRKISIMQDGRQFDLQIENDLDTQRITFSDKLLFETDDFRINGDGETVLTIIGRAIRDRAALIKEIQIQGHADTRRSSRFSGETGNTVLAAMRGLEVFKFLQDTNKVGIDPVRSLMSVTSFGEFKPVRRDPADPHYTVDKLNHDNSDAFLMDQNRRIEIVLIYRR